MTLFRFLSPRLASALLLPLGVMGCASVAQETPVAVSSEPVLMQEAGPYQDYLSAQFAYRQKNITDTIRFLSQLQLNPEDMGQQQPIMTRQLFTLLAGEGQVEQAIAMIPDLQATGLIASLLRASYAMEQGDYEAAYGHAKNMTERGIGAFVRPLVLAWTTAATEDRAKALLALAPFKEQKGLQALYHLHAGLLYHNDGLYDQALRHYDQASEGPADMSLRLVSLYAKALVAQGKQEEARALYKVYAAHHPNSYYIQAMMTELENDATRIGQDPTLQEGLAEALFGLASSLRGDTTRQTALIMGRLTVHLKPNFPLAHILVAEILEADDRLADANKAYLMIPSNSPFLWPARLRVALNENQLGKVDTAINHLTQMIGQEPTRLESYITLADIYRQDERYGDAEKTYRQAIELIGDDLQDYQWDLIYSHAITLERLKRWPEAEPLFLQALEMAPNQPHVLNYLGYSWVEQGIYLDKAQAMIEEAVARRPRDGFIVDSLGWVQYRLGDYEKAVENLERAVDLEPTDPTINDHLGDAYWQVGRYREARFQWQRAKSLDPTPEVLSILKEKLAKGLARDE